MVTDVDEFILPEENGESINNDGTNNHEVEKTSRKVDDHSMSIIDTANHENIEEKEYLLRIED